jgi:meso-butanediol dehydrogenase/(S,S)-butanediol dehydrogenase/diacetyl reductase
MLEGKKILVTGAGQGIGRGIARAVAEAGADVGLLDLNEGPLAETAEHVEKASRTAQTFVADVTDADAVFTAIGAFIDRFGRLDGLVNNAGVIEMGPAIDVPRDRWDWQFGVNVWGLMNCCQLAARRMIDAGGGAIVNIASNAGKVGYGNMAAYNATKAAVINLTRTLSSEWSEHGINVNAVCPGGVDTPMLKGAADWVAQRIGMDAEELYGSMKPNLMPRHIQPIEVGRVVAFLLSDAAVIIRGQSINIDGGDTPY